ncbi:IS3 family transposase [Deinococcus geothermalis]|uniref:IS3 family transposase n=1 Tax=Deinococcus geothermalis TaxID=68909 RepID=UPI000A0161D8|nr:IS3 family transposase [Deinococcus geothermalis]
MREGGTGLDHTPFCHPLPCFSASWSTFLSTCQVLRCQDIEAVVEEFSGYGYRRVTRELARRGRPVNHKRVLRVMRERRLLCRPRRRYRATTNSNHGEVRFPNLLREVIPVRPDQVWQADLTYVRVQQGFV